MSRERYKNHCLNGSVYGTWVSETEPEISGISSSHETVTAGVCVMLSGLSRIPYGIASFTKVEGRNEERRRNQGKTF
jgi:hypothetical protein